MWGNCEVITRVDIGSDHRMARARVEINKKLIRLKKIKKTKQNKTEQTNKQNTLKLDLKVLERVATPFRIELKNRFDTLKDEEPSIEKMNKF